MKTKFVCDALKLITLPAVLSATLICSTFSHIAIAVDYAVPAKAVAGAACPGLGWSEGLVAYLQPKAAIPTNDTKKGATDCNFHEWSWEAFVWATALDTNGVPRFMTLPTLDDLLSTQAGAGKIAVRSLRLATRSLKPHGVSNALEVAGAIVEADGNMLVAPNGYPVYASVHMNPSYFATAKNNLIINGGYEKNLGTDNYFNVGDAIFKATWVRVDASLPVPVGGYTTQAEVPVLTIDVKSQTVVPNGSFVQVTVALVGLHVVGNTVNHPEFLWATFEHKLNSPQAADNTFSTSGTDPNNYTFYKANTSFAQVNLQDSSPATLSFNEKTQRFSPVSNAVQENKTGGENFSPQGPENIANLNKSAQGFLSGQKGNQTLFANYNLIGTVWLGSNTYVGKAALNLNQTNALGSVNLANTTAETFIQYPTNTNMQNVQNCFLCHNAGSYSTPVFTPGLAERRVAISHVLSVGTNYAVPNLIPLVAPTQCKDVSAGPIWNNADAKNKCPAVCGQSSKWNGQWVTTVRGTESVCGCCTY